MGFKDQFERASWADAPQTKNEVFAAFEKEWGVTWKEEATAFLSGTRDKKSRAWKSAARNFQKRNTQKSGDGNKPTKKWKEIGKKFGPKKFRVQGTIIIEISKKKYQRRIDITLKIRNLEKIDDSGLAIAIVFKYMGDDLAQIATPVDEDEWRLTVTPEEDDDEEGGYDDEGWDNYDIDEEYPEEE